MAVRLGNVLLLASILIAIGWAWHAMGREQMDIVYAEASVFVLVGMAARYVSGKST